MRFSQGLMKNDFWFYIAIKYQDQMLLSMSPSELLSSRSTLTTPMIKSSKLSKKIIRKRGIDEMKKIICFLLIACLMVQNVMISPKQVKASESTEILVNTTTSVNSTTGVYSFILSHQGKVHLSVTNISASDDSIYLSVYETDQSGNEVLLQSNEFEEDIIENNSTDLRLNTETYIIKVAGGSANLSIIYQEESNDKYETEKNNSFVTANVISPNIEYTGNIQTADDVDYYKVDITNPGSLYLNFKNTLSNGSGYWNIELYEMTSDGNRVLIEKWSSTQNKNSIFTKYRLPANTYYIKISKGSYSYYDTSDYTFKVNYSVEASNSAEIESNNTIETANIINTNTEYVGNIQQGSDKDYYLVKIDSTQKIQIRISTGDTEATDKLFQIRLYRKYEGNKLVLYDRFFTTNTKLVNMGNEINVGAGDYIIQIENGNGEAESFQDYYLKLLSTNSEENVNEPGSDLPEGVEGVAIAVNSKVYIRSDEGNYTFKVAKQGKVYLNVKNISESEDALSLSIYQVDQNGNEVLIQRNEFDNDDIESDSTVIRVNTGTYIIRVGDGAANLSIIYQEESSDKYETESNNSFVSANVILPNIEYNGNIQTDDDKDFYKIIISEPGSFCINFKNSVPYGKYYWFIELYREDLVGNRNLIKEFSSTNDTNTILTKYSVHKGTYFVRINKGYDLDCTDYGIVVNYVSALSNGYIPDFTNVIEGDEHNYSDQWSVDVPASCEANGSMSHHCLACTSKKDVTVIPATGHSFGEWSETKKATYFETGIFTRTCTKCGKIESKTSEKLNIATLPLTAPQISAVRKSVNQITLKWTTGSQYASGYEIFQQIGSGDYVRIKSVAAKTGSTTIKINTVGQAYYYKIREFYNNNGNYIYSAFSADNIVSISSKLPKPTYTIKQCRYKKSKAVSLDFKSIQYAEKIDIYVKEGKKGKWRKLDTCSKNDTGEYNYNLTKKKVYYYKIRTYATVGSKKVYSPWSVTKSIKIK